MATTINIGIIGFSPQEEKYLKKIFALSTKYERAYKISNIHEIKPVQLLLVKKTDTLVLQQQQAYLARYKNYPIIIVAIGREAKTSEDTYYIRGVLLPSRVLAVLDEISIPAETVAFISEISETHPQLPLPKIDEKHDASEALRVLVVDDSPMMQKTIQLELNQATIPLEVDFADTGENALEQVQLKRYDFIFLDVMMPSIDGFETCSQIRKLEGMAKIPIIMLTSKTSALDEVKGLMAGCTTYLTKPFVHDDFHSMLERVVNWVKDFNDRQ
jgi:twitching motility two-component system response regulator PilG